MIQPKLNRSNHWLFFLLTFIFSWLFWGIAILLNQVFTYFPTIIFYILGGFGPSIIGIILTYLSKDKEEIKDFWHRSRDFKRINYQWYGAIIIITLTPHLIAGGLSILFGGSGIGFNPDFVSSLLFSIIFLIIGVLAEEFGWRGFVLDPLQKNYNALTSSLILGFFWALWHLPLFFIDATYQQSLGLFSLDFWMFFIVILPSSVFYTWIFNNTNRSILSAILLHFCVNFFGELFSMDVQVRLISNIFVFIFAILIVLIYGYRNLTRV
jgi:membrane protease YdiL (CAAX protease family)